MLVEAILWLLWIHLDLTTGDDKLQEGDSGNNEIDFFQV